MSEQIPKVIDVEKIIRSKIGKDAKIWPPLLKYFRKILHEDEFNEFFAKYPNMEGADFLRNTLKELNITLDVHGEENLPPKDKLYTFVSNHPLGGPDGVAIGRIIADHYDDHIRYLVNSFLMALPPLAPLSVPVNQMGGQARNMPQQVDSIFSGNDQVIMFPAQLCSRKRKGVIKDLPWKKTFIQKSVQYQRDVVPIYFEGRNSNRFYNIANLCKFFGIKFNIAMLFLVDEMFRHRGKTFRIYIGKPIAWETFDKTKKPAEWASYVQDIVYGLAPAK
ncbi:MAG: glycerol acyltransferase [Bacteroidaceae bacterium]|nr:glycerol acyltransferase [Bacteroidaceae bacterium]